MNSARLVGGALVVLCAAVTVAAVASSGTDSSQPAPAALCPAPLRVDDPGFPEPPELRSIAGLLRVDLRAAVSRSFIAKPGIRSELFNGTMPGPTLRVCAGDLLRVELENRLRQPTNLHTHGLHVSPRTPADNVMVTIPSGANRSYAYRIPATHPAGTYWYHPHRHGYTRRQVARGMAGALIVDDPHGNPGVPERLVVIQENRIVGHHVALPNPAGGRARMLINGRLRPTMRTRPGAVERWRVINATADRFLDLRLPGRRLELVAYDGADLPTPQLAKRIVISPGERRDLLVTGAPGRARFETRPFRQAFTNTRRQVLADVIGAASERPATRAPLELHPGADLREDHVVRRRVVRFQSAFPRFLINGRMFNHHRIDYTVTRGTTEEWELRNDSDEWHSFHIHTNDFQVTARNGQTVATPIRRDTVRLPPRQRVTIRQRFDDFTGTFVFHCHILQHEDRGMMATVRVVP